MALRQNDLAKANKAWPIVRRNLDRVNNVILNMLAYSTSRKPLMETININYVLNECVEMVSGPADEKHVAVVTDLADLPPIPADSSGLNQAVLNLLTNALDAVSPETGVVTLVSSFDTMNRLIVIKVTDNGTGIEASDLKRIWEPFHSTKGQKGSGLGLAVARKVVEEQRGKIEVQSEVGKGTTFTIRLPAIPPSISPGDTLVH
jgi:signal transduction histidine kinase